MGDQPQGALLIVLDASGSMGRLDADGVAFIDKAKQAVLDLVDALPDGTLVGLRVYGHREPNTDPVRGCQDTELVAPVAPLDRAALRAAVAGINASGFTPIGLSLQQAADDLPDSGARSIILISDGEDTCAPPDPCDVAEQLYGDRFDVRIETIGFLVDSGSATERQLRCIADVTGGSYSTVGQADALGGRLGELIEEAIRWQPRLALNGALQQAAAPDLPLTAIAGWVNLEPGKIAVGDFDGDLLHGETRWYRLSLWEEETAWVWADLYRTSGEQAAGRFETIILDEDGERADISVIHGGYQSSVDLPSPTLPMTGTGIQGPERGWPTAATYLVGFHWDAPPEEVAGFLNFTVEVLTSPERYVPRVEVAGALDPAGAPVLELEPLEENGPRWLGAMFRGPIASGETRWYRVDVDRRVELNASAMLPGDRVVGEGATGSLAITLTDLEGNDLGRPFEPPRLQEAFGVERPQARVGATTEVREPPRSRAILVGFTWDGTAGQSSELRFEVETLSTSSSTFDEEPEATAPPGGEEDEGGGAPIALILGVIVVLGGTAAGWMFRRSRRADERDPLD